MTAARKAERAAARRAERATVLGIAAGLVLALAFLVPGAPGTGTRPACGSVATGSAIPASSMIGRGATYRTGGLVVPVQVLDATADCYRVRSLSDAAVWVPRDRVTP